MVKSLNEELSQLNPSILSNKKDPEDKILKLEYDITEERKFNNTRKDMTTKLELKVSEVTVEKELLKEKIKNLENALNVLLQEKVTLESKINKYYRLTPPWAY